MALDERKKRRLKVSGALAALALAALAAERLYETDRKQIRAVAGRMAEAVYTCDEGALLAELTDDFADEGVSKEDFHLIASNFFRLYGPTPVRVLSVRTNISGDDAIADLHVYGLLFEHPRAWFYTEWRLGLVQKDGQWRVDRIVPLTLRGGEVPDLKSLAAYYGLHRRRPPEAAPRRSRGAEQARGP